MQDMKSEPGMPPEVAAIRDCGFANWVNEDVARTIRSQFASDFIPVRGIRHVRVWGIQVDDERVLPGRERTMIPDEELWQVELEAADGSRFEVNSQLLVAAPRG